MPNRGAFLSLPRLGRSQPAATPRRRRLWEIVSSRSPLEPGQTEAGDPQGGARSAISDGLVALLKEFFGRGPESAKTYVTGDLVVCLLRGGLTRIEHTLIDGGHAGEVIRQRIAFQEVMRERFEAVVTQATGRPVIGFMSGNQEDPDLMCEVFVLAPETAE